MKKRIFILLFFLLFFDFSFSLEFKLEYQQRLNDVNFLLEYSDDVFLVSDSNILFTSLDSVFFLLNYRTNKCTEIDLSYIDGLFRVDKVCLTANDDEIILVYFDSSSNNKNYSYALVNLDINSFNRLSQLEIEQMELSVNRFDYTYSNILHNDYQLWCYVDSEIDEISAKANWLEDCWYKIAFIKCESILNNNSDHGLVNNKKIIDYVQTLCNQEGEELILGEYSSTVTFYPERRTLIVISDVEYNDNNGPTFESSTLYIYKLIYDATCNDTRVRIREEPNLSCSTLGYLNAGDAVKVTDKSDDPFEIDGESWYWYKVESDSLPDGWVYGKYLDIEE